MNNPTCVQCQKEMPYAIDVTSRQVSICLKPECPNYGLLQLGNEAIDNFLKDK